MWFERFSAKGQSRSAAAKILPRKLTACVYSFEWAKVFYVMLYKFRTRDLEHFNMAYDEEEMDDDYEDEITEHQGMYPTAVQAFFR